MSADLGRELEKAHKALQRIVEAQNAQTEAIQRIAVHLASIDASLATLASIRQAYVGHE